MEECKNLVEIFLKRKLRTSTNQSFKHLLLKVGEASLSKFKGGNFEQQDRLIKFKMNVIKYSLIVDDINHLSQIRANILYLIEWQRHKSIQKKRF